MKKTRLSIILVNFFTGGSPWCYLRLLLGAGIMALFFFFERQGFSDYTNLGFTAIKDWWPRFLLVPLAAWLAVMMLGAYYVRDVYELPTFWMGLGYVVASLFGLGYPVLKVSEGKKKVPEGSINLIERVGGPGYLAVKPGSAVLLERTGGPSHVFGAGPHFVSTGETIRETVSLEDQDGFIEKVPATTKDGIPILVHDIHFRYRLRAGKRPGDYTRRTPSDPYPFSQQALRQMAYLQLVRKDGPIPWRSTVQTAVEGVITEYITQHKLDSLTSPRYNDPDPRKEIEEQFQSSGVRSAMRAVGADLLWVDMGHFEVADKYNKVNEQRAETWASSWKGEANVVRASGEAEDLRLQQIGRAEGQADLLIHILNALDEVHLSDDGEENIAKVLLWRTAQVIDAMSENKKNLKLPPPSLGDKPAK